MKTINELTVPELRSLLSEYATPSESRPKISDEEIKELVGRLNKKIDIPIIGEGKEECILKKVIIKIDDLLYYNLPNEFYDLIRSLDEGIDDEEAKRLIAKLTKLANSNIDIPYIPEAVEAIAIKFVIGVLINSARKKWKFENAVNAMDNLIPDVLKQVSVSENNSVDLIIL